MNILAFDTCFSARSVALQQNSSLIAERLKLLERGHAEEIFPMISEVLSDAKIDWEEIDCLGITYGPGTFTGLRVGLAAARGIALTRKIPISAFSSLHAIAAGTFRIDELKDVESFLVVSDARRNEVYIQSFNNEAQPLVEPALIQISDVISWASSKNIGIIGSGVDPLFYKIPEVSSRLSLLKGEHYPQARDIAALTEEAMSRSTWSYEGPPSPIYLRAPHVKMLKKSK